MRDRIYYVYILASLRRVLYVGVTNHLVRRVLEHRAGIRPCFTRRYRVTRLVHVEATEDVHAALARERALKGWRRERKVALIESTNPHWRDLFDDIDGSA